MLKENVRTTEGAAKGEYFERLFASMWLEEEETVIEVYTDFHAGKGWAARNNIDLSFELDAPPRMISFSGTYFPTRLGCMHRLTRNAPSVDFYLATMAQPAGEGYSKDVKYRIYLFQTTIGKSHTTNFQRVTDYICKMNATIANNRKQRARIQELSAIDGEIEKREVQRILSNNKYLIEDTGRDLQVDLTDESVEIWLVYLQDKLNDGFSRPSKNGNQNDMRKRGKTNDRTILNSKIHTVYAHIKPDEDDVNVSEDTDDDADEVEEDVDADEVEEDVDADDAAVIVEMDVDM